jgi:putative hydrolase of the HAD superfamily
VVLEAVIFDWGGTLSVWAELDLEDVWRAAACHLDHTREAELVGRLIEVERRFWARVEATQESARLSDVLEAATAELEVDVTEAVLQEAATHHLDAWTPHIRHDADARDVLAALRSRGLRIGLLSNTMWPRAFHERFLERDGLDELIDARLYTSDLSHIKPHASAFKAALDALRVRGPDAVFVGDRPFDDIRGAKAVGMRTVWRPNPSVPEDLDAGPDAIIHGLPELIAHVDRWMEERVDRTEPRRARDRGTLET